MCFLYMDVKLFELEGMPLYMFTYSEFFNLFHNLNSFSNVIAFNTRDHRLLYTGSVLLEIT